MLSDRSFEKLLTIGGQWPAVGQATQIRVFQDLKSPIMTQHLEIGFMGIQNSGFQKQNISTPSCKM